MARISRRRTRPSLPISRSRCAVLFVGSAAIQRFSATLGPDPFTRLRTPLSTAAPLRPATPPTAAGGTRWADASFGAGSGSRPMLGGYLRQRRCGVLVSRRRGERAATRCGRRAASKSARRQSRQAAWRAGRQLTARRARTVGLGTELGGGRGDRRGSSMTSATNNNRCSTGDAQGPAWPNPRLAPIKGDGRDTGSVVQTQLRHLTIRPLTSPQCLAS